MGTLGRVAQVSYLNELTVVDSHVTQVRPSTDIYTPYLFGQYFVHLEPRIEDMGKGSTGQTELSRTDLGEIELIVPSRPAQIAAEELFCTFSRKQAANAIETETLASLRDTLLPKLISGELPIKNAEKFLEQAGV